MAAKKLGRIILCFESDEKDYINVIAFDQLGNKVDAAVTTQNELNKTLENMKKHWEEHNYIVKIDKSKDYTFARGLHSILRQDPDVVMVGELRDLETAEVAIQAALTGHLVVSTIHTNSAAGASIACRGPRKRFSRARNAPGPTPGTALSASHAIRSSTAC